MIALILSFKVDGVLVSDQKPARYDNFRGKAEDLITSPARVQKLIGQATRKLAHRGEEGFTDAKNDLQTAIALVKAWFAGEYREVNQSTLIAIVAAILYFVVPLDVIPDFIFGWGFVDDIAVIGYVFGQIKDEITAFREWHESQGLTEETDFR